MFTEEGTMERRAGSTVQVRSGQSPSGQGGGYREEHLVRLYVALWMLSSIDLR